MPTDCSEPAQADVGSSIVHRYAKAAAWSAVGGIVSRCFQGITPLLLARVLGPTDYGIYSLAYSLIGVLTAVSSLGQSTGLQKFLPEYSIKDRSRGGAILVDTVFLVFLALGLVSACLFFSSSWMATSLYHDASLIPIFQWCALLVCSLSLFNLTLSVAAGLQEFSQYSVGMIARSVAFFVCGLLGALLCGLKGAIAGQVVSCLLGFGVLGARTFSSAREKFPGALRGSLSSSILSEILHFLLPALLASLVVVPASWWSNTVLQQASGFKEVGQYGFAFALGQIVMLVPLGLSTPAISFFSETHATNGPAQLRTLASQNLRLIWVVTLPICLFVSLFSGSIISLFFGQDYSPAITLVPWMCFTSLVIVLSTQIGAAIASIGRMWDAFALNGIWFLTFMWLVYRLTWSHKAMGLTISYALSYLVFTLLMWQYSERVLAIRYSGVGILALCTAALFFIVLVVLRYLHSRPLVLAPVAISVIAVAVGTEWRIALTTDERLQARTHLSKYLAKLRPPLTLNGG